MDRLLVVVILVVGIALILVGLFVLGFGATFVVKNLGKSGITPITQPFTLGLSKDGLTLRTYDRAVTAMVVGAVFAVVGLVLIVWLVPQIKSVGANTAPNTSTSQANLPAMTETLPTATITGATTATTTTTKAPVVAPGPTPKSDVTPAPSWKVLLAPSSPGCGSASANALWSEPYPGTTSCTQGPSGASFQYQADPSDDPDIYIAEDDLAAINQQAYPVMDIRIQATFSFADPSDPYTLAGPILLTPQAAGSIGGYYAFFCPPNRTLTLYEVPPNGGKTLINQWSLPANVDATQPLTLTVQIQSGKMTFWVNQEELNNSVQIDPQQTTGTRVVGIVLDASNKQSPSSEVTVSSFTVSAPSN